MESPASGREILFQISGTPPLGTSVSLALQHLVAMIVGCVTPPIIVAGAAGLPQADQVLLIQASLVMSAVSTLLQLYPIGGRFGSGLPVILGVSFAYVPSMQAIASSGGGVSAIAGAMLVGGVVAVLVGVFVKKIRLLFPPVITGTVVFTIGLSLYPTAINYMAGGTANTHALVVETKGLTEALVYGSWQNWLIASLTLAAVMALNHYGRGLCRLASILLGMIFGYLAALGFGMVSFADVGDAAWFSLPRFLHFGMSFDAALLCGHRCCFINSIQAIGDFTATTVGGPGPPAHGPGAAGRHCGLRCQQHPHGPVRRAAHSHLLSKRGHCHHQQGGQPHGVCPDRRLFAAAGSPPNLRRC